MSLVTPIGVAVAVLWPAGFLWLTTPVNLVSPGSDWEFFNQQIQVYVFILLTLPGSLTLKFKDLLEPFRQPKLLLTYFALASIIMPAVAFFSMKLLFPGDINTAIGFLLVATIPSGASSFIWVTISKGNKEFSLGVILITNLLAVAIIPATLQIFVGETVPFDIPKSIWQLCVMLLIPTLIGVFLNEISNGKIPAKLIPIFSPIAKLSLIWIVGGSSAIAQSKGQLLWTDLNFYKHMLLCFILCLLLYLSAWGLGDLFKQPLDIRTSLFFSHGCKNIGSGLMLAAQLFANSPGALVPLVATGLFMPALGGLLIKLLARKHRH
jgi:predicted Na+-dependent transporter